MNTTISEMYQVRIFRKHELSQTTFNNQLFESLSSGQRNDNWIAQKLSNSSAGTMICFKQDKKNYFAFSLSDKSILKINYDECNDVVDLFNKHIFGLTISCLRFKEEEELLSQGFTQLSVDPNDNNA